MRRRLWKIIGGVLLIIFGLALLGILLVTSVLNLVVGILD